jgi:hypothetical protein
MSAREQALADQGRAAAREAIRVKLAADIENPAASATVPDLVQAQLIKRLTTAIAAGRTRACQHGRGGPSLRWWLPARPALLGCAKCTRAATARPAAQPACGACGSRADLLPASFPITTPSGSVLVVLDLCGACRGDQPATPEET